MSTYDEPADFDPTEDKTAPGRVPPAPAGADIEALAKIAHSIGGFSAKMQELVEELRVVGLSPAARLTLAAELREAGNSLRTAAVLLEGRGPWMPI